MENPTGYVLRQDAWFYFQMEATLQGIKKRIPGGQKLCHTQVMATSTGKI